jgi:hypothetical protein
MGRQGMAGIQFAEFESTVAKLCHAFTCIPAGVGLLSPCNRVLKARSDFVYLHKNHRVLTALEGCRTLLRESTREPMRCREPMGGWPDFVGIINALGQGARGIVIGKLSACTPTVFQWQWPDDIKANTASYNNPTGKITNSDIKMAGILLLWLTMKGVCGPLHKKRVTLFSDNTPTVDWVTRLASKKSTIAEHLIQALALHLKSQWACPLTPMHIEGKHNAIADVPSRLFGSNPVWHCNIYSDLLTLFNSMFPLPNQLSWTVFHLNCRVVTHVILALQMKPFALDNWRQLPKVGRHVGNIGAPMSNLWGWIHTFSTPPSKHGSNASQALPLGHKQGTTVANDKSRAAQLLMQSRPLARQLPWPAMTTPQR